MDSSATVPCLWLRFLCLVTGVLVGYCLREGSGTTIHVVFSNHLDVGFTSWDNETLNQYFHAHIPRAIWLAQWLQLSGSSDSFRWTTHPWLLDLFFNCPGQLGVTCPSQQQQAAVVEAAKAGVITWHAAPFNLQWEMLTHPADLAAAVQLARRLDEQLGQQYKTVISLRDVPGLTRAVIPLLVAHGIRAVTVGVNAGSAPPGVPLDTPFIWRDMETDTSLLAMWHAGGYGGSCNDVMTGQEVVVGCRQQCVAVENFQHVLCFSWRADNQGPTQSALEVQQVFNVVRQQWPEVAAAAVVASTLEEYVDHLAAAVAEGQVKLPVVTGEIGDTWVYGVASDPLKVARYRAAARARTAWQQQRQQQQQRQRPLAPPEGFKEPAASLAVAAAPAAAAAAAAAEAASFDRLLVKVPEHTWGLDVKTTLSYFNINYSNKHLHKCMAAAAAAAAEAGPAAAAAAAAAAAVMDGPGCAGTSRLAHSWQRQAAYVDLALQELPEDHPIVTSFDNDMQHMTQLATQAAQPTGHLLQPDEAVSASSSSSSRKSDNRKIGSSSSSSSTQTHSNGDDQWLFKSPAWVIGVNRLTGAITKLCRAAPSQSAAATPASSSSSSRTSAFNSSSGSSSGSSSPPADSSFNNAEAEQAPMCGLLGTAGSSTAAAAMCSGTDWAAAASQDDQQHSSSSSSSSSSSRQGRAGRPGVADWSRWRFAAPLYVVHQQSDYDVVWNEYAWEGPPHTNPWFVMDLGKPGLDAAGGWMNEHVEAEPHFVKAHHSCTAEGGLSLQLHYKFAGHLHTRAGAPREIVLQLSSPSDSETLGLNLVWLDKTPTRLPEALWLRFRLVEGLAVNPASWRLHKLGSAAIDPQEVLINGSHSMHAVDDSTGVSVLAAAAGAAATAERQHGEAERLIITPLDSPLVSPGGPMTALPNVKHQPRMSEGVSFNIHNNLWGTNYINWLPYQHTHQQQCGGIGHRLKDASSSSSSTGISTGSSGGRSTDSGQHASSTPHRSVLTPQQQQQQQQQQRQQYSLSWLARKLQQWVAGKPLSTGSAKGDMLHSSSSSSSSSSFEAGKEGHPEGADSHDVLCALMDQRISVFRFLIRTELTAPGSGKQPPPLPRAN